MSRQWINTIKDGSEIYESYLISKVSRLDTKAGKKYLRVELQDSTGLLPAVMWDLDSGYGDELIVDGAVLMVTGRASIYNGTLQIQINFVSSLDTYDQALFEPTTVYDIDDMYSYIIDIIETFAIPLKTVSKELMTKHSDAFKRCPAAKGMHHAFVGGLLEHTYQMIKIGESLFNNFKFIREAVNKDLCLFGLMFHDFGKIFEYEHKSPFSYTAEGKLVPHIPMTAALILESCEKNNVDPKIRNYMMHVVLAHHGRMEWGSPVNMAIPEAMFVHYIDNLHGDMYGCLQAMEAKKSGNDKIIKHFDGKYLVTERFSDILSGVGSHEGQ